jgi:membrane-bound inhibitor of C-type lysozyme
MMRNCRVKQRRGFGSFACILTLAALFTMAGCSGTTYLCENGKTIEAKFLPRDEKVKIDVGDGTFVLPRVPAASGSKYSDGSRTFWFKGDELTVESAGKTPYGRCALPR